MTMVVAAEAMDNSVRPHIDGDLLRIERRIVRHVIAVCHQKLQRVSAGRQLDDRFRLATAEMQVLLVAGYRLIEWRQVGIDQQMMMPGVRNERPAGATPKFRVPNQILNRVEWITVPFTGQPIYT